MMTNEDIWKIALQQSAYDSGCQPEDFLKEENVVTISKAHPLARKYLKLPLSCDLVSYGSNIVAQASEEIAPLVRQYIDRYPVEHCFETPNLHMLPGGLVDPGKGRNQDAPACPTGEEMQDCAAECGRRKSRRLPEN